jgi:hypothetical protein
MIYHLQHFQDFLDNLKNVKSGKSRATKGSYYDLGQLPQPFKPRMAHYNIEKCPWIETALPDNESLLSSSTLYKHDDRPQIRIKSKRLMEWENSNRQSLSVASHLDHFLWAGKTRVKELKEKLEVHDQPDSTISFQEIEDLWNDADQAVDFLQSAAKGLQDLVKATVNRVCWQVTVRRDSWLERMDSSLPKAEKRKLRALDCNSKLLFNQDDLEAAKKQLKSEKEEKVQNKFLESEVSVRSRDSRSSNKSYSDKKFDSGPQRSYNTNNYGNRSSFRSNRGRGSFRQRQGSDNRPKGRNDQWDHNSRGSSGNNFAKRNGRGRGSF